MPVVMAAKLHWFHNFVKLVKRINSVTIDQPGDRVTSGRRPEEMM